MEAFEVERDVKPVSKPVTPQPETPVQPAIQQEVTPKPIEVEPVQATVVPPSEMPSEPVRPVQQPTTVESTPSKEELSDAQEFAEDLQAILNGEKTYDAEKKQVVSTSPPSQPETPLASTPHPHDIFDQGKAPIPPQKPIEQEPVPSSPSHAVFDQMGKNMAHATDFDQGTVDLVLEQRFDEFDQLLDKEEKKSRQPLSGALEEKPAVQTGLMTAGELKKAAGETSWPGLISTWFSTYAVILEKLKQYDELLKATASNPNPLQKLNLLMQINDEISTWLDKNSKNSNKETRKNALEELQKQIGNEFEQLAKEPVVIRAFPNILVQDLKQGIKYAQSSTILFSYLVKKILSIYKEREINQKNFKQELRNFLIANNDLIGATSSAIQTAGNSGKLTLGFDFGKLIFPFLGLSLKITGDAKSTAYRLIVTECQAQLDNNLDLTRYALMNMNGGSTEGSLGISLAVNIAVEIPSFKDISKTLEISSFNCISEEIPSAEAGVKAEGSAGVNVKGVVLKVSDPNPIYFDSLQDIETPLLKIVRSKNKPDESLSNQKVFFSFFSHAYGGDAEIGAEGNVKAISAAAKAEIKAGINASVKFSKYTYQTKLLNGIFKTQVTKMSFKQISIASGPVTASVSYKGNIGKEKQVKEKTEYSVLNSLYYESGFLYWDESKKELSNQGQSGFSRGHSISSDAFIKIFNSSNNDQEQSLYAESLGKSLKVDTEIIKQFLVDIENKEKMFDILKSKPKFRHFIEATFIPSEQKLKEWKSLNIKKETLQDALAGVMKGLKTEALVLQSLRFRSGIEGSMTMNENRFKLGLNLKVFQLGIDLGRVEDAGSLKLTDYIVTWFDEQGNPTGKMPDKYVPTSFLFL
ncbi:MAG: hypothetical protein AB4063_01125 [Crocosphaera sp.]